MNRTVRLVSCTIFIFAGIMALPLYGQNQTFSGDSRKFVNEAWTLLRPSVNEEKLAELNVFFDAWDKDTTFSEDDKNTIIRICNRMFQIHARAFPHLFNLLADLQLFRHSDIPASNYNNWLQSLDKFLQQDKPPLPKLSKLIDNTQILLKTRAIFKSSTIEWRTSDSILNFTVSTNPAVKFDHTDLICMAKRDTMRIIGTSGVYNIIENTWSGTGGLVTWQKAGFPVDIVHAELTSYRVDLTKTGYKADSVIFTNKNVLSYPLKGTLTDEAKAFTTPENADNPTFQSYTKSFFIKKIYENMDYRGGLSMEGARLIGSGSNLEKAGIYIYRKDTLFMKVFSLYFIFRKDRLTGRNVSVTILMGKDSIYHGQLNMAYQVDNKEISFIHTDDYTSNSPWYDSYHDIDMSFDRLTWKTGDSKMYLTMQRGSSIGIANFESKNFFSGERFAQIQMYDPEHPLYSLKRFAKYFMYEEFPLKDYANFLRLSVDEVRKQILQLAVMGFVYFNTETDMIRIKQKLYDYLDANAGRIDYDVISLISRTEAPQENASLDLRTYDLAINGTPLIFLSDSQNVAIYPKDGKIVMKKNRSFQFDGRIIGGLFDFYGKNFFFDYSNFKINLQKIDSLYVNVVSGEKDNFGRDIIRKVINTVQQAKGQLLIDKPDNKSGIKRYPEYPIFISNENSYVYYDNPEIQNGVYKRDKFYFQIYPYTIDSLDNFKKSEMKFKGKFVSAGILPDLEENLVLQPDYSFGLNLVPPATGLPLYGGKGKVFNYVEMSNLGLKSRGTVNYLTSTTTSDEFLYFPDSMNTTANQFAMKQQSAVTEFPKVNVGKSYVHWMPGKNEMFINQKTDPFRMFNDTTTLAGDLKLTPKGLTAHGKIDMRAADFSSNLFSFKSVTFDADTVDFNLKSLTSDDYLISTKNLKAHVDFSARKGNFFSNTDLAYVEFPKNKYIGYLAFFTWKMDDKELEMGSKKKFIPEQVPLTYRDVIDTGDMKLVGARFISVKNGQDSLSYMSPLSVYDYKTNVIRSSQVKYIKVADAKIIPDKGVLDIDPNADMQVLEKATVIASMSNTFHRIHNGLIRIEGRYDYHGSGDYDYKDETGKIQVIHFDEIKIDTSIQTTAQGNILTTQDFTLSPTYEYQGKVFMYASQKYLTFKGGVRIKHACNEIARTWMSFNAPINPDSLYIPVSDKPVDINKNQVFDALFISSDSIHQYPAFLSYRKNYSDQAICTASGYLHYVKDSSAYVIGSYEKIHDPGIPGNLVSLNRNKCRLSGEGTMDLGINLGKVKLAGSGSFVADLEKNTQNFDLFLAFDFKLAEKAIQFMAADFDSLPGQGAVDLSSKRLWKQIELFTGKEKMAKMKDDIALYGTVKEMPAELQKMLVISDVKMRWNDEINAYQSYGKIGISNIMNSKVNKYVEGYIEIVKKRSGDMCDIYLKLDDKNWYYFGYTRGVMQTLSSNRQYIDAIKALSVEQRTTKAEKITEAPYTYMLASDVKWNEFRRKYQKIVNGEKVQPPDENNNGE